jgi:hypothetical protein
LVKGWLTADPQPLDAMLGSQIGGVEVFTDTDGQPLYYVVHLDPLGFVIVPADDLVEPIIGFTSSDTYDPSPDSVLAALVTADLTMRIRAARTSTQDGIATQGVCDTQDKWYGFMDLAQSRKGNIAASAINTSSLSDFRVAPLTASRWGLGDVCSQHCYNYYTPEHYVCGCVATAMAQLMLYHCYPTAGIGVQSFTIAVAGNKQTAPTRGGDGQGGPYRWSDMDLIPDCDTTETQRQAIGALCYDAGVAAEMSYKWDGKTDQSATAVRKARDALTKTFQYSNAIVTWHDDREIGQGLTEMINPNLDAGYPVILGLRSSPRGVNGHAVVADGYGYNASTLYHHLNYGDRTAGDVWYNLPDVRDFNVVGTCIYNVFPEGHGEIVSGRVTDTLGNPIVSATVVAQGQGGPYSTTTDARGIFAFARLPSDSSFTITVSKTGYRFPQQVTATGRSDDWAMTSGNRWKVDFVGAVSGDWNRDNFADFADFAAFALAWRSQPPDETWDAQYDISNPADNRIDALDLAAFADEWLTDVSDEVIPADPGTDGLVAYYPLSNNVQDASGNDHHGVVRGTPTYVEGPAGGGTAMHFGGAGNYVDLRTFNPSAGTGRITIALWTKWDGGNGSWQGLIGKRDTHNPDDMMWEIEIDGASGVLSMHSAGIRPSSGDCVLPIDEWAHIAVTFDGAAATFYFNGEKTGSGPFSFGSDTEARVQFGASGDQGEGAFNGALDEIRMYRRVLSHGEVGWLAGRTAPYTNGLVAYYPLSHNTEDASGNGHHGVVKGAPAYVDGPAGYGTAMRFRRGGNYVDLGTFNPSVGTGKITVALWAKWEGLNGEYQGLIGKRDTWNAADMMWQIQASNIDGNLNFYRAGNQPYDGDPVLPVGEWAHVAATFDGVTATFYVDGEKTGCGPFSFGSDTKARVQFGDCRPEGTNPFNGTLDEVRIYNQALPQEEVGRLAGRTELHTLGLVAYYPLSGDVKDVTGNGHDGDPCGTLTYVEGPAGYGTAMHFGGTGNLVDLGTFNPSAGTGMITVALWAKWDGWNGRWQGLIGKRDTWALGDMMWELVLDRDNGAVGFIRWDSFPDLGGPVLPIGVWTHVAVTFDGTMATLYIDGEKTGSGAFAFDSDADARIQLGCSGPMGGEVFNGALDEVRIYNRLLPQSEVIWLAGKATPAQQ